MECWGVFHAFEGYEMIFLKIYLLGVAVAFFIELMTLIRINDFCVWAILRAWIGTLLSWLWVLIFLSWVFNMMGWDYEDVGPFGPYTAWRLKQRP